MERCYGRDLMCDIIGWKYENLFYGLRKVMKMCILENMGLKVWWIMKLVCILYFFCVDFLFDWFGVLLKVEIFGEYILLDF